jgi:hypothetical protein
MPKKTTKLFNLLETERHTFSNYLVIEEIREESKKFLDSNENENITFQNLWDTVKAV